MAKPKLPKSKMIEMPDFKGQYDLDTGRVLLSWSKSNSDPHNESYATYVVTRFDENGNSEEIANLQGAEGIDEFEIIDDAIPNFGKTKYTYLLDVLLPSLEKSNAVLWELVDPELPRISHDQRNATVEPFLVDPTKVDTVRAYGIAQDGTVYRIRGN